MEHFTPISSLLGGLLIGLASAVLLVMNGRICGISGIAGGLMNASRIEKIWRIVFLAGLIGTGAVLGLMYPQVFVNTVPRSPLALAIAGLLVGVGTRVGSGCTSGHGVCGISRGSRRSILATMIFIAAGMVTVFVVNKLTGGVL